MGSGSTEYLNREAGIQLKLKYETGLAFVAFILLVNVSGFSVG